MSPGRSSKATSPPRGRALVLLVVFLLGHTSLLPGLAGCLAAWDGGHLIRFSQSRSGIVLTLQHSGAALHQHSLLIRALAALTVRPEQTTSDHTICFPFNNEGIPPAVRETPPGPEPHPCHAIPALHQSFNPVRVAMLHRRQPAAEPWPGRPFLIRLDSVRMMI